MRNVIGTFTDLTSIPPGDNEYYFKGTRSYNHAWKLHLCLNDQPDVYPDLNDPLIRGVSSYLIENNIQHKYANGGDGFKTYTIYTGTPEQNFTTASDLNSRFSFPERPRTLESSDLHLASSIYTRFEGQPYNNMAGVSVSDAMFMHYGLNGIPMVNISRTFMPELSPKLTKPRKMLLHNLAGHVFCARHYGANYLGMHYADTRWDHGLFSALGDALSLDDIQSYIDRTLCHPLPHTLNMDLVTSPVELDLARLTGANNGAKNAYGFNTDSIIAKMDKPTGTILSRHADAMQKHDAARMIERVKAKWDRTPL